MRQLQPARDALAQLRENAVVAPVLRYGQYAVLPLLAVATTLAPEHLSIRWAFAVIVVAGYLILRGSHSVFGAIVLVVALLALPHYMDKFERSIMFNVALYALLGIGLNVVVGYAGLLDLGYVAFFATGAYLYALIAAPEFGGGFDVGTSFWIVLPMAMVVAGLVGAALGVPVLRLRGDYLAIVTLGFGEIIRIMVNNEKEITNGPVGVFSIPKPDFYPAVSIHFETGHVFDWLPSPVVDVFSKGLDGPYELYYLVIVGCFIAAFAAERILDSRVGRAWEAIREDEDVAAGMGVDTTVYKLLAFAIGAAIGGAGGVIYAAKQSAVFPTDFNLDVSINVLALVIVGGMGNVRGILLGSILLIALPEVLRDFSIDFAFVHLDNLGADYRLVIFGAALVAVMVLRPEGLMPSRRRAAEFKQIELIEEELAT